MDDRTLLCEIFRRLCSNKKNFEEIEAEKPTIKTKSVDAADALGDLLYDMGFVENTHYTSTNYKNNGCWEWEFVVIV